MTDNLIYTSSCLSDQRYNFLKANHNYSEQVIICLAVVYQIKDTIFWKQITTDINISPCVFKLFIRSKIQFFESKSQPLVSVSHFREGCLSDQRYNFLKANHNLNPQCVRFRFVVYQIKDTIFWKQITTTKTIGLQIPLLFIRSKIQFFESKSQLRWDCLFGL